MNRDNTLLALSEYPAQIQEKVRYADTDRQGHINNAVFSTLFECGRVAFLYDPKCPLAPADSQFVIANISINYLAEINWPSNIHIGTGVLEVGRSSFKLRQGLFCGEQCVANADSVMVLMSEQDHQSTPLPESTKAALKALRCHSEIS